VHALCDALLGAAALGDIGKHFPDTDMQYRNVDSRSLLRMVYSKVKAKGWKLVNADMTIVAQRPRMATYIPHMVENLSTDLQSEIDQLNVKATTTERLGFTGREEGIAAYAVVLLEPV
jgi:2-C-methyl-D-erythritol 2,4-cyclodiphosphate synthase